ncbi:DUF5687 family protein [Arcticibacter sp.]|uniref:DUF5687 family protein n=1 Tax=Arcticibacter sp. TaxID=1872630 RepID=UPI003890136E
MTLSFFQHQWKAFWRSKNTGKSVAVRVVMAFLTLYLFLNIIFVAFFLDEILDELFPSETVISAFNGILLYYFLMDILTRFQLQELPTLSVRPYLTLPVTRRQIVNYLSVCSLWTPFNIAPLLLTLPFLLKQVLPYHGAAIFLGYLVSIISLTLFNHFFSLWFKRKVNINSWFLLAFVVIVVVLALLDFHWEVISFSDISRYLFSCIYTRPLWSVAPAVLAMVMFLINYSFLKNNLYLDELRSDRSGEKSSTDIALFNRFGIAGELAASELKLIMRNKRPGASLKICGLMMFYGLLIYTNPAYGSGYGWKIFVGMFMTGIFIINYGQFMFGWQSSHFDGIMAQKVKAIDFFRSKFILFYCFSIVAYILTIPYVYFGWEVLLIHSVMFLWNIGVNTLIVLYFATRNYKRIDLTKGSSFNWEGVGASQWILSIPLIFLPYVIFLPFSVFGLQMWGILLLALSSIALLITRNYWLGLLVQEFNKKRYTIAEGFRNE